MIDKKIKVGILGAGTMGTGIAQVAAAYGHDVYIYDNNEAALRNSKEKLKKIFARLIEKEKISEIEATRILNRIHHSEFIGVTEDCGIIIEAIVEILENKQEAFRKLEKTFSENAILATNTSSLSVTSIASACKKPERVIGIHFFNPAPILPLVEIVPGLNTSQHVIKETRELISAWGKTTVVAKDTPGFIVNRVARPFYGEALRIYEEGFADFATIDWAMKEFGNFKMGPFELMDLIGNDVNYEVTKKVFEQFYFDPRFKPSQTQKLLVDAKHFGKKSGKGFYDYSDAAKNPKPLTDPKLGKEIFDRIIAMLINEAADAVFMNVASVKDVDLAMTKGVNYPKGLCEWADEIGIDAVVDRLQNLYEEYGEDRYRVSPLLKRMKKDGKKFYE